MDDPIALVAAERRALADLVDTLDEQQLSTPSLCAQWSVQDVVAHLAGVLTGSLREFAAAMVRGRLSFARANVLMTASRSGLPVAELTATLREHAEDPFTPPGMDWHAPLADVMVHREDVTVPLGLPSDRPVESWRHVLDFLVSPRARRGFVRGPLPGVRLAAGDLDWAHGEGPEVRGPAAALALAVSGRPAGLDRLDGPGAPTLRGWATR